jgi:hypothetical protein
MLANSLFFCCEIFGDPFLNLAHISPERILHLVRGCECNSAFCNNYFEMLFGFFPGPSFPLMTSTWTSISLNDFSIQGVLS